MHEIEILSFGIFGTTVLIEFNEYFICFRLDLKIESSYIIVDISFFGLLPLVQLIDRRNHVGP